MKIVFVFLCLVLLSGCASPDQKTSSRPSSAAIPPSIELNAKWKDHAPYFQKIIKSVDKKWESILSLSKEYPAPGTVVVVKFRLEAKTGDVVEIITVDSNGTQKAADMCVRAITANAPYGPFPAEMMDASDDSTVVTFTFHYK